MAAREWIGIGSVESLRTMELPTVRAGRAARHEGVRVLVDHEAE